MESFVMDEFATLEAMGDAALVDLEQGLITLYAVVCIGNEAEHFSHGGTLCDSATEAIELAVHLNQGAPAEGLDCRYLAAGVGLSPFLLIALGRRLFSGGEEAGD